MVDSAARVTAASDPAPLSEEPGRSRTGGQAPPLSLSHGQILKIIWSLQACLFVASLSHAVIGAALPTIVGDLGGQDQLAWAVSAMLLTSTVSTPLWGKVSDLYGRKPLMHASIATFVVASTLAGVSQNMEMFIVARAGQGIGAGGIFALAQAIVADVLISRDRGRYSGYFTAGGVSYGVATISSPFIGGFLVDGIGWRWCFYICIPIAVVASVALQRTLRLPVVRRRTRIDWLGALFITAAISALLLLISLPGKQFAWASGWTALLAAATAVSVAAVVLVERRAADPILPPRLFRSRTFCLTGAAGFVTGFALAANSFYLPQYLQVVQGRSATMAGLLTMPMVVTMLLVSIGCGWLITRWGRWKVFPLVGLGILAAAATLLSTLRSSTDLAAIYGYVIVFGAGLGLTVQVLVLAVQNTSEHRDLGIATSCALFFRSMGSTVSAGVVGAVISAQLTSSVPAILAARQAQPPPGPLSSHLGTPAEIAALPEPLRSAIRESFTLGLDRSYLILVPLVLLSLLALIAVKGSTGAWPDGGPHRSRQPRRQPQLCVRRQA